MQIACHTDPHAESKDIHTEDVNAGTGFSTSAVAPEADPVALEPTGIQSTGRRVRERKLLPKKTKLRRAKGVLDNASAENLKESELRKPLAQYKIKWKAKERRKYGAFTRRLWSDDEDEAIIKLVKKYGIRKWTLISRRLQEEYQIYGRSGKQCRER